MSLRDINRLKRLIRLTEALHRQSTRAVSDLNHERDVLAEAFGDARARLDDPAHTGGVMPSLITTRAARLIDDIAASDARLEAGIAAAVQTKSSVNGARRRMNEAAAQEARESAALSLDESIERSVRNIRSSLP